MRNLTLISSSSKTLPSANVVATTIDLDENILYAASEHHNSDGDVEVEIWKLAQGSESPEQAATFKALSSDSSPAGVQTISFRFIAELRRIVAIMYSGDVISVSMEEGEERVEVEGSFPSGILATSWNPDESVVAIVTGERRLILLTSLFDVISERPLQTDAFGEDAPINVGWGSKQTQFHGSLGKSAAQAQPTTKVGLSPDDDHCPRISWRGDGAFFAVSSISQPTAEKPLPHRTLRVYDRQCILQSTSEDVPGLEHDLAWKPSGNLIVGTQRFGFEGGGSGKEDRHDVVFFERNGLRHGEFSLRVDEIGIKGEKKQEGERKWGYRVRELSWNADSNVLAIWIEGDIGDIVQFWTTSNYHWYLKHEIVAPWNNTLPGRFTSVLWHPEQALSLTLTTSTQIFRRAYLWDTWASISNPPNDSGIVAVLDGSTILLTPFRSQNVPPPMASLRLTVKPDNSLLATLTRLHVPVYISFALERDDFAVLWENGSVNIWSLNTKLGAGPGKIMNPVKLWSGYLEEHSWRQVVLSSYLDASDTFSMTALGYETNATDFALVLEIQQSEPRESKTFQMPYCGARLLTGYVPNTYEGPDGLIITYDGEGALANPIAAFPEFSLHTYKVSILWPGTEEPRPQDLYIGLGKSGKVYASLSPEEYRTLATNANSLAVASGFVIFTTTSHEAIFAPIDSLPGVFERDEQVVKEAPSEWQTRKVERGSRIVVPVPSSMSLVLQMPRGNLETINPRPLVMQVVNQDVDAGNYRKAFFACRKHRVDLNAIVDRDRDRFMANIRQFIEQVHEVDHLNLFLTLVGRGSQSPDFVAQLCNAFREELEKKDLTKYVNCILTTHVVKTPPDQEGGLALIQRLRDSDEKVVDEAVKYIIFLVDADRLFDTALGMYDFSLVMMVAQHAQKDPREYLPFLRQLRAMDKYYQRFKIDDHLKRYQSALKNLSLAGPDRFEEAVAYLERHQLYDYALAIWRGTDHYSDVLDSYGDWLYERREFRQAAAVFVEAERTTKAMMAYERALEWQQLFDLATIDKMDPDDIVAMGYRVAEELSSKKRHTEAGRVLLDYSQDTREAVIAFVQGNAFSEARRVISLHLASELLEDVVHPASLESRSQIAEDIGEMREQIRKQRSRLQELRVKKEEEPDAFYGTEDNAALHDVDVMTDVSMPATAFTRYTVAPTTASRSSRQTSRSKRKMERKIGSGKRGTIDEEEYLLRSVTKLVERFKVTQGEARSLLPHLYRFTEEHREEGKALQREVAAFEAELAESLNEIWQARADNDKDPAPDGWAARMAEREKNRAVDPLEKVPKPDLSQDKGWRINLFELS